MQNYFSVDEISTALGVNRNNIYKKIKQIGLNSKELGEKEIEILKDSLKNNKKAIDSAEMYKTEAKKIQSLEISNQKGSTNEQRLIDAKQKFDNLNRSLAEYQIAIDTYGEVIVNEDNKQPYSNPIRKAMNETLKQYNAIQKTINELEEKLKLTSTSIKKAIDD